MSNIPTTDRRVISTAATPTSPPSPSSEVLLMTLTYGGIAVAVIFAISYCTAILFKGLREISGDRQDNQKQHNMLLSILIKLFNLE